MLLDFDLVFSALAGQTVTTGSDAGVLATNVYDLGVAGRNPGVGETLYIIVGVVTALEGAGDTCDVEVVSDSVETLDDSLTIHQVLGTFPAEAPAGTKITGVLPPDSRQSYERYLGLRYFARGSGALTAGAFFAVGTLNPDLWAAYADSITIS